MTVAAIKQVAKACNGAGAFILQCKSIELCYCDRYGSSRGQKTFISHWLPTFAKENPQIEFIVLNRPGHHPILRGRYINGREKVICVRNMTAREIQTKAELLRNASGMKLKRFDTHVESKNASVRGIWSPFHVTQENRHIV
ncbi:54S ribosomal protein L51, mitochondrial [Neolecta irregularis DAH-3]|uniref:Large ribosomal subunit protein mL43 n=1 Tax=Neolecta irregularis (strain DAH-3) TaxID=1198029 RepID=A0A1U7LKF9_NEOID|nr:54S ribosomal protein L51, mitochondrial [Neolecta irregularis DAH-3]|eukprot:OLL23146.1 54S ribosomal protein L51, mitochondrial [Neolecta irregularis DAH-3]